MSHKLCHCPGIRKDNHDTGRISWFKKVLYFLSIWSLGSNYKKLHVSVTIDKSAGMNKMKYLIIGTGFGR